MTTSLPDTEGMTPREARICLHIRERAQQIIAEHAPGDGPRDTLFSPLTEIKVEALAYLTAFARLHTSGAEYHRKKGDERSADLWERDALAIASLAAALHMIEVP